MMEMRKIKDLSHRVVRKKKLNGCENNDERDKN